METGRCECTARPEVPFLPGGGAGRRVLVGHSVGQASCRRARRLESAPGHRGSSASPTCRLFRVGPARNSGRPEPAARHEKPRSERLFSSLQQGACLRSSCSDSRCLQRATLFYPVWHLHRSCWTACSCCGRPLCALSPRRGSYLSRSHAHGGLTAHRLRIAERGASRWRAGDRSEQFGSAREELSVAACSAAWRALPARRDAGLHAHRLALRADCQVAAGQQARRARGQPGLARRVRCEVRRPRRAGLLSRRGASVGRACCGSLRCRICTVLC